MPHRAQSLRAARQPGTVAYAGLTRQACRSKIECAGASWETGDRGVSGHSTQSNMCLFTIYAFWSMETAAIYRVTAGCYTCTALAVSSRLAVNMAPHSLTAHSDYPTCYQRRVHPGPGLFGPNVQSSVNNKPAVMDFGTCQQGLVV